MVSDSELFRVLAKDGISSCKHCEAPAVTCALPGVTSRDHSLGSSGRAELREPLWLPGVPHNQVKQHFSRNETSGDAEESECHPKRRVISPTLPKLRAAAGGEFPGPPGSAYGRYGPTNTCIILNWHPKPPRTTSGSPTPPGVKNTFFSQLRNHRPYSCLNLSLGLPDGSVRAPLGTNK